MIPFPGRRAAILALVVLAGGAPGPVLAEERATPDSTAAFAWGGQYRSELAVRREAAGFSWNDEERSSSLRDRLALYAMARPGFGAGLYAKGASGPRIEGAARDNRFILEQAHALWSAPGGAASARLFARERVYASNHRLMKIASDDAPFLEERGEGARLDAGAGDRIRVTWIESALRAADDVVSAGGLPLFRGGADVFRSVRLEARPSRRLRAGALFQQVRSIGAGDAAIAGVDLSIGVGGASLIAELARSTDGAPDDLFEGPFLGVDLGAFDIERPSRVFSERAAFAAEAEGLRLEAGRFGSLGFVPGYRFVGASFRDPAGEIAPGTIETSALLWYRPASIDVLASLSAADTAAGGAGGWRVTGRIRGRLRGGIEASHAFSVREGGRTGASVSIGSDAPRSRARLVAYVDDPGGRNDPSCFAEGVFNLGARLAAGCSLYLPRPGVVRYALSCEFRTRERFLLTVAAGSFVPAFEELALLEAAAPPWTGEDRALSIAGRIGFGGM